ncbi:MAG TPA: universal stress protein [Stellaceae bacterium]
MLRLLLPVDGSEDSLEAVRYAAGFAAAIGSAGCEVHLLNVQPPLPPAVRRFIGREDARAFFEEEGRKVLEPAEAILKDAGVAHEAHIAVGNVEQTIVDYAGEHGCDQIVMRMRNQSPIEGLLLGSTTLKVLNLSTVPVTLLK